MTFEAAFNYCEAAFWFVIAGVVAVRGRRQTPRLQRIARIAAVALAVFGISDLIEVKTGSYWEPRWLFVMKSACVTVLGLCLWRYHVAKKEPSR
jgi:hypothetical protein